MCDSFGIPTTQPAMKLHYLGRSIEDWLSAVGPKSAATIATSLKRSVREINAAVRASGTLSFGPLASDRTRMVKIDDSAMAVAIREVEMPPLPRAAPTPCLWSVACPTCGNIHEIEDMDEDIDGTFVVPAPDRYPLCDQCDTQFEIARMRVAEVPDV